MPDFVLDPATPLDRAAPEAEGDRARGQVALNAENFLGLQRAVVIVLGDKMLEAAAVVVLHLAGVDVADAALDDHVLVNLALFISSLAAAEKADVPGGGITGVAQALIKENQVAVDVKTIFRRGVGGGDARQLVAQLRRGDFIGI